MQTSETGSEVGEPPLDLNFEDAYGAAALSSPNDTSLAPTDAWRARRFPAHPLLIRSPFPHLRRSGRLLVHRWCGGPNVMLGFSNGYVLVVSVHDQSIPASGQGLRELFRAQIFKAGRDFNPESGSALTDMAYCPRTNKAVRSQHTLSQPSLGPSVPPSAAPRPSERS